MTCADKIAEAHNWPDRLMLRDTGLHDDLGGPGQRIYTTAGRGYERVEYVRADLADAQAQEIAELRRMLKSTVCYGCNRRIGDKQWLGFICVSCKSKREFLSRAALGDAQ